MTIDELKDEVMTEVENVVSDEPDYSSESLERKVSDIVGNVMLYRGYARAGYTEAQIEKDILQYRSLITEAAIKSYSKTGVEGQSSHQENGMLRTYMGEKSWYAGIIPLTKIF